eukprot:8165521-Alexandrium_andersonii.AAC.1
MLAGHRCSPQRVAECCSGPLPMLITRAVEKVPQHCKNQLQWPACSLTARPCARTSSPLAHRMPPRRA